MTKVTAIKRIITVPEMIKAIKEHYNLNDTLLAINLNVTNQTIKAWKEGKKPRKDSYLALTELYNGINSEEQTEEAQEATEVTEVTEKKPYEISYPIEYKLMWYLDDYASVTSYQYNNIAVDRVFYESGLLFDTKEEAEQFKRERALIKKIKYWAKEQQGDWEPDWSDIDECKYYIYYDGQNEILRIHTWGVSNVLSTLPTLKTTEIAKACIDEFGDEILEVFC